MEYFMGLFLGIVIGVFCGSIMTDKTGNNAKLNKQYEQCLNNIPRNKYCKFVSANFEIVDKDK